MISRLQKQLDLQGIILELKQSAKNLLIDKGYDPAMGARPMRRCIQNYIEDPLSDRIIGNKVKPGSIVEITADKEIMKFSIKKKTGSMLKV